MLRKNRLRRVVVLTLSRNLVPSTEAFLHQVSSFHREIIFVSKDTGKYKQKAPPVKAAGNPFALLTAPAPKRKAESEAEPSKAEAEEEDAAASASESAPLSAPADKKRRKRKASSAAPPSAAAVK